VKRARIDSTVYALRFNAHGQREYVTLGGAREGWAQAKAQEHVGLDDCEVVQHRDIRDVRGEVRVLHVRDRQTGREVWLDAM
jgi:hypothetical protein